MKRARMKENKDYMEIAELVLDIQYKLSKLCEATLSYKSPKDARASLHQKRDYSPIYDDYADLNEEDAVILNSFDTIDKALHTLYLVSHAENW